MRPAEGGDGGNGDCHNGVPPIRRAQTVVARMPVAAGRTRSRRTAAEAAVSPAAAVVVAPETSTLSRRREPAETVGTGVVAARPAHVVMEMTSQRAAPLRMRVALAASPAATAAPINSSGANGAGGGAGLGGGIANFGTLIVSNSTINSNTVSGGCGGRGYIWAGDGGQGLGGGIFSDGTWSNFGSALHDQLDRLR